MKRTLSLPILILLMLSIFSVSCTRDDRKANAPLTVAGTGSKGSAVTGNKPPIIIAASIYPDPPVASKALIVNYTAEDAERDTIQYVFRWYVDGVLVQDGPEGSLQPGTCRKGSAVYVDVLPSDQHSPGALFRTKEVTVTNAPPVVTRISLLPEKPGIGALITAAPEASDPDGDSIRYTYQWFVNGNPVTEPGESSEFRTQGLRKKDRISVIVIPSDGEHMGVPRPADILTIVNTPPRIASAPSVGMQNGAYRYQVTAQDDDGDKLAYSLTTSPQGMTINPSTGLITWEPKPVTAREEIVVKIVVSDGDGGSMTQDYSLILEPQ